MVVESTVITKVQNFIYNDFFDNVDKMRVGDDNTTPDPSDTDVKSFLEEASIEEVDVSIANQISFIAKYGITSFNGSTIREVVLKDSVTPEFKTRNLTTERLKSSDQIFWVTVPVRWEVANK